MPRRRIDVLLVERGLVESRQKAQALILAGRVTANGQPVVKAGQLVAIESELVVKATEPYVSRGGYKLASALDRFQVSVTDLTAVDIGASTGGFTDVLLQRGARRVYAVDVGRGQLHWRLRSDPRVVVLDRTNARYLQQLPEPTELATIDVSFISLRLVLPAVRRLLLPGSSMIALVKPQFEAGRADVGQGGIVRSPSVHRRVLVDFVSWLSGNALTLLGLIASPIRGAAGNVEFLAWLGDVRPGAPAATDLVEQALDEVAGIDHLESSSR